MESNLNLNQNNVKKFNYSLFVSLMLLNFVPTVYETIKVFFVNNTVASLDVVSQIEWFDLIDEVLTSSLTIPLYYLLNKYIDNKDNFKEKVFHSGLITFIVYGVFSVLIYFQAKNLSVFMGASNIGELTRYLQLETIAFVIGILYTFCSVVFILIGKSKYIYCFLVLKTIGLIIGDFLLIPRFGSFGVAYANMFTNFILAISSFILLVKDDSISFSFKTISDKLFFVDWARVGLFEAGQIFLDNYIYAVMVCKMVNEVQQQGNYWIANNFIWGWLLVPSFALAGIIKRDCKDGYEKLNQKAYKKVIVATIIVWIISIPLWNLIFGRLMGVKNVSDIFYIVICLLPFYITYLVSSYIDNIFYGLGKTHYTMFISFVVNVVYYGIVYILFKNGMFTPSINFIIMMFGGGMVVHLIVSICIKKICLDCAKPIGLNLKELKS